MKLSGYLAILSLVLMALKLFAGLAISWFWVLAPLLLVGVLSVGAFLLLIIMLVVAKDAVTDKIKEELKK